MVHGPAMASNAAKWCGGRLSGPDIQIARSWKHDSNEVRPGDAFVALRGERTDGHLYAGKALERGARLLLVEEEQFEPLGLGKPSLAGLSVIAVENTERALADIARGYLKCIGPKVIAITGSVGKTTTREMVVAVLSSKYRTHSAIRSFNTLIGSSLTILSMPPESEVLVLEFGANRFGEIEQLAKRFMPEIAVITEVAPAHLEGFGSTEGVLRAKMEICTSEALSAIAFNGDNLILKESVRKKCGHIKNLAVGYSDDCDCTILGSKLSIDPTGPSVEAEYSSLGQSIGVCAPIFGRQHAYNMGYAAVIGQILGITPEEISTALSSFKPIAGRGAVKRLGGPNSWVIDEAYNANPRSMAAAIDNVKGLSDSGGRKLYAVLGGMRELGGASNEWHEQIAKDLGAFEKVILLGAEWESIKKLPSNALLCSGMEEVISAVLSIKAENCVVLIKGSNSYNLKKIVGLLTEGTNVY
jgi:UDP-N-acetylmuramoyl-tripeptide--D-alanyl-D-alanine ligase